jgi:MFS superfamily sulfate permease-like transporter
MRWLPGIATLRYYEIAWLRHDLLAGLVLTAVLVPVGIAYAVAAGVPAICGLSATIAGLVAYALFGPSRVLVLGPDSSLVALILAVVLPLAAGDGQRAVALAGAIALVSGTLCVLAGAARLGFVTELLSKPIRYGYMNGIALTVLVSQLPALFGFSPGGEGLLDEARAFADGLVNGKVNWVASALGPDRSRRSCCSSAVSACLASCWPSSRPPRS